MHGGDAIGISGGAVACHRDHLPLRRDLADQARDRYDTAQDLVRHNPSQSVAAAFGIGLVAGLVVGLALRSR